MHKHLKKMNEHTFDKIFNQQIGFHIFKDFCNSCCEEPVPQLKFYEEVIIRKKVFVVIKNYFKPINEKF
jgi:hypothetical protein